MQSLRNIALGICILCSAGGIIQIFWPENSYKPVINTVLVLYIITSALQMHGWEQWHLPQLDLSASSGNPDTAEYQSYVDELAANASAQALQELLQDQGIDAKVTLSDKLCRVSLSDASDSSLAEQILQENCGTLPYEITWGGEES